MSAFVINCQLTKYEKQLLELRQTIAGLAGDLPLLEILPDEQYFIAMNPFDGHLNRTKILEMEGNEVHVSFIDWGNVEKVGVEEIKSAPKEFMFLPQVCKGSLTRRT